MKETVFKIKKYSLGFKISDELADIMKTFEAQDREAMKRAVEESNRLMKEAFNDPNSTLDD